MAQISEISGYVQNFYVYTNFVKMNCVPYY